MGKGSKNLSKNNRKLALENQSTLLHYRMYKAGRMWLFAGVATFTLSAGLLGLTSTQASAKTVDTTPTSQQQPAVTGNDVSNGNSTTLRTTAPAPSATEQSTDKAAMPA
ncbi:MAG TPA: hypothetical protein DDW71_12260, partial [Lactobacillus sp.]|nr:hypothetical protein [Lactobacillus sp.]